jgi:hypothetical protein
MIISGMAMALTDHPALLAGNAVASLPAMTSS